MPLLSIVVPTRDRAETALPCIRHLLALPGDDFEVVVTDCSRYPDLRERIAAIDDQRLIYAPIAPCSMTDNFNNGYAHCRGEYVTYIGDDDAFLASGLHTLRRLARHGVEAIASPYRAAYFWDSFPDATIAGRVFLSGMPAGPSGTFEEAPDKCCNARTQMLAELRGPGGGQLPVVYHGIVARRHLDTVAHRTGNVFRTQAPDTYVTAALCSIIGDYVVTDRPLSMFGKSGSSNSARLLKTNELLVHRNEFTPQQRAFDPLVAPVESVEAYVADSFVTAFKAMEDDAFLDAFLRSWLARSYSDSLRRNPKQSGAILSHLLGVARRSDARVVSASFAAGLVGQTVHRIGVRIASRLNPPRGGGDEIFAVPSYEAAIAMVDARLA